MHAAALVSADEALARLLEGNRRFLTAAEPEGDVSLTLRRRLAEEGQTPYAVVVTCSDSRVPPEYLFSAPLGGLFVIRVAGNVMDAHQLGSVEYAAEHLGCRLVLVLGHTRCGAVGAALSGGAEGYIKWITDEVLAALGDERDETAACEKNVRRSVSRMEESAGLRRLIRCDGLKVVGGIYDVATGEVRLLESGSQRRYSNWNP